MPERSVSTLKFIARRPRLMAKRTIFATIQPASSTTSASARRGRKSPTCRMNARTGSSITSNRSMSLSLRFFDQRREPLQRDVQPRGPVVELVAQLVERFFDLGEAREAAHVLVGGEQAAALHRLGIRGEEGAARARLPGVERRPEPLALGRRL